MGPGSQSGGGVKLIVAGLLLAAQALATAATLRPPVTGEQVVRDMLADPAVSDSSMMRERAMGYIDGIMDMTVGVQWCPAKQVVPHELNYVVAEEMKALGTDRLRSNAAPLIAAILRRHYPCHANGRGT
jgi:hypothetical protein